MSNSDELWLSVWGTIAAVGFIIVIIGVTIEGVEHFKKFPRKEHARKLQIEKIGWFLVVAGLAMEFLGDHAAKRISNREDARVNKEAGDARKEAEDARVLAAQIGIINAQLVADNLVLRSNVVALELKLKPRIITVDQVEKFIFLTEKITKIPIKICVGMNSQLSYAIHLRGMFSSAKFGTDSSVNASGGLTMNLNEAVIRPPGESYEWPAVIFVRYATNKTANWHIDYSHENTNGFNRPITLNTNDQTEIFSDLAIVFQQIDIPFSSMQDTVWVKPGEMAILVPPKNE